MICRSNGKGFNTKHVKKRIRPQEYEKHGRFIARHVYFEFTTWWVVG